MTEFEWQPLGGSYVSGSYRIDPIDNDPRHHWRLTAVDDTTPPAGYKTLSGARLAAVGLERARIRRARVATHSTIGIIATLGVIVSASVINDLPGFVVMTVALWLAVRSFVGAVSEQLGDPWGGNRAPGTPRRITTFDRAWAGVVEATRRAVAERITVLEPVASGAGSEPKVRILPPEPPG